MPSMKAVLVKDVGKDAKAKATDLYLGEREVPELKDGDVLVKIEAFGINRMDIMQRQGLYPVSRLALRRKQGHSRPLLC